MNYRDSVLLDALAGEYVLGTLRGPAARRFEKLAAQDLLIRQAVQRAERRLTPLAASVKPIKPPAEIWGRIEIALALPKHSDSSSQKSNSSPWLLAAAISMLAIASAWFVANQAPDQVTASYVSLLNDGADQPAWLVQVYRDGELLVIQPVAESPLPDGRVFELWMLPEDGRPPQSLGVIDAGNISRLILNDQQLQLLAASSALAISTEPPGGSPTGVPTGDVVFVGPLVSG